MEHLLWSEQKKLSNGFRDTQGLKLRLLLSIGDSVVYFIVFPKALFNHRFINNFLGIDYLRWRMRETPRYGGLLVGYLKPHFEPRPLTRLRRSHPNQQLFVRESERLHWAIGELELLPKLQKWVFWQWLFAPFSRRFSQLILPGSEANHHRSRSDGPLVSPQISRGLTARRRLSFYGQIQDLRFGDNTCQRLSWPKVKRTLCFIEFMGPFVTWVNLWFEK